MALAGQYLGQEAVAGGGHVAAEGGAGEESCPNSWP